MSHCDRTLVPAASSAASLVSAGHPFVPAASLAAPVIPACQLSLHHNKENEGVSKALTQHAKVFYDPDFNKRNAWQQYKLVFRSLVVAFCAVSLLTRQMQTFGRWVRKDGKPHFVTGAPSASASFNQPVLEVYSWKVFFDNGKEVRVFP